MGGGLLAGIGIWTAQQTELIQSYDGRFYPGTVVNGYNVEGKTKEEVLDYLNNKLAEQNAIQLILADDSIEVSKTLEELGIHYDSDLKILDELEEKQQSRSWAEKLMAIHSPLVDSKEFKMGLEEDLVKEWVSELAEEHDQDPIKPTVELKWRENKWMPTIKEGVNGASIEKDLILKRIEGLPSLPWKGDHQVLITFDEVSFEDETDLLEQVVEPIGTWKSYFNPEESRAKNVKRAAELVHNSVVMPGETFSYNEKVLPATIENGYGYGIIFVNGEKVPGLAGGICQVSSTLYNAVLEAGITADARTNHSMFVEYVPYGQDATMNDSGLDFKFTNPYDVPILIQATTSGSYLTISLWSAMDVLDGLDYKAYTEKINEKTYDTYLQAFNSEGVLISSKYLHRSIYR